MRRGPTRRTWLWLTLAVTCVTPWGCATVRPWTPWAKTEKGTHFETPAERTERLRELALQGTELPADQQERIAVELAAAIEREEDPIVRSEIVRSLGNLRGPTAARLLTAATQDGSSEVRVACCDAWGVRADDDAVKALTQVLAADENIDVRLAAARGLGQVRDPQAVAALGQALEDNDPALQYRAVQSLRRITGRDLGDDANAWREFVARSAGPEGQPPLEPSLAERIRAWF